MGDNYIKQGIRRNETYDTKQNALKHTYADVKTTVQTCNTELDLFLKTAKQIILTKQQKEDINTNLFMEEDLDYFTLRAKTNGVSNIVEELKTDVADEIKINLDETQADGVKYLNQTLEISEKALDVLIKAEILYNEYLCFYEVDNQELKLNTLSSENFTYYQNGDIETIETYSANSKTEVYEMKWERDPSKLDAKVTTYLWTTKDLKGKETHKWEKKKLFSEDISFTQFPVVIENENKIISDAVKEQVLALSELYTSNHKEIVINPSTRVLSEDVIDDGRFDNYQNSVLPMTARANTYDGKEAQDAVKLIQGTMRAEQFAKEEEFIQDTIKALVTKTNTKLGLAPSDTAVTNAKERNTNFVNNFRKEISELLSEIVFALTQKEYKITLPTKESQSLEAKARTESLLLENGQTTEFESAKKINPQFDDDKNWEIALTSIIRRGLPMTALEREKAIEIGIIDATQEIAELIS